MRKPHTTQHYQIEMLAIQLYLDNVRVQPTITVPRSAADDPKEMSDATVTVPTPRWAESGLRVRTAYRQAAIELLGEYN